MTLGKKEKRNEKQAKRFPLYVVKRLDLKRSRYWIIRLIGVVVAFILAGVMCTILAPGSFALFYQEMGRGCFDFSDISSVIDVLVAFALLMMIALILTPSFRMKFWNIGAEGQILVGALAAAGIARYCPSDLPNGVILLFAACGAMAASTIWCVIPAFFKAFFNTNETLFTLMMNYIATILAAMMISIWIKSGSGSFGMLKQGTFPKIFGNSGTLVVLISLVMFFGIYMYLDHSKFGYSISVLGESVQTARYAGINEKYVTIRTMAISGVLFGLVGFMIVCGVNRSFSSTIVGGRGFTGVMIAWLGNFNPFEIALYAFLSAVMERGTITAASAVNISSTQFSAICSGIFFFTIIACEFFCRYQIKIHHKENREIGPISPEPISQNNVVGEAKQ